jgi:catalase
LDHFGDAFVEFAERLGHESTRTVFDVYGYLYDGVDEAATDRLEQARNASRADQARTRRGPEVMKLPTKSLNPLLHEGSGSGR